MASSTVSAYDVYWEYQALCIRFGERMRGFNMPFGMDRGHLQELRRRADAEKPPVPIGDPDHAQPTREERLHLTLGQIEARLLDADRHADAHTLRHLCKQCADMAREALDVKDN